MSHASFRNLSASLLAVALTAVPAAAQRGGRVPDATMPSSSPQFKFMGPALGNRIAAVAGVPGDATTYYAGAASGGVWKSIDSGASFAPVFDSQPVQAIGALGVSRSNHEVVWAGTGEAWAIRDSDMMGDGVYKSTDAGATWTNMGLRETGRIGRILIHPTNPDIVYVCAAGRLTGPQQERGVFRTSDGGKTWRQSLFVDADTGCSGLSMDAAHPDTLFAGTWRVAMHTYGMFTSVPESEFASHGPGSGVYVTHDGGASWKRLEGHGLPQPPVGKVDVAIAPGDPRRVYALIQTADQGSLWRSDDGGENWTNGSWQRALIGRAGYYIHIDVSPADPDEVLVTNSSFWLSQDGGKSFTAREWGGGDTHDIWIDPTNAGRIVITHDLGMNITTDHGGSIHRVTLPIGQMYHVAVDNDVPYHIYGNMQDDGTMRGLSTTQEAGPNVPGQVGGRGGRAGGRAGENPAVGAWDHGLGGCESGFTVPDLTDSNFIWASCYGNEVTTYDYRTKTARSVSPWLHTLDSEPDKSKYRCHWTPPLVIDPFDHNRVYYGCQVIFRTTNGGTYWSVISPDLSHNDPRYIVSSGGLVGDNLGQFYGEVVFAIAPSEIRKDLVWAGTNDGKVWYTTNAGAEGQAKWIDVTGNIQGLPPMGVISKIEPSHFDPAAAYIAVDFHLMDNRDPWLYKTADYGKTWTRITGDLPTGHPLSYARVIAENPNKQGMLFAGTGHALYYSMDDGAQWTQMKGGLPAAPVSWIAVQKQTHDLVVSTYGRGLYILEDMTPLEQGVTPETVTAAVEFLTPRPAYRQARGHADWTFVLKEAPRNPIEMQVVDEKGAPVRKLPDLDGRAGWNRASWDLRYEAPRLVALRTTPPENPHIWEEPRFRNQDTRPITHWGIEQADGPLAGPGKYTLRMTVDGQPYAQPIEVLRMPDAHGSDADLRASASLQVKVRDDIDAVSDMANQIERMRRQLEDQGKTIEGRAGKDALVKAMDAIDKKMQAVEYQLISRAEALSDDKYFVTQYKLYMNLLWLSGEIGGGAGDVAGSGDYGPTETAIGLVLDLEQQLQAVQGEYQSLMDKDVAAYNRSIAGSGLAPLPTGGPAAPAGRGGGK
jgi:photosystem II stability/assembly factor-like uncharacterized protein